MIEVIQSETKKVMYACMKRYAEKESKDISNVQLVLGIDAEGNTYTVCENYEPKIHLDFNGVLGVRIDFLGRGMFAPQFIRKSLERFAVKHKFSALDSKVMCVATADEKNKPDVLLFVYNKDQYVETINFADLFREEDFEMPTM
jgi:hypothetical protein